jgi:hypothetical protein
LLELEDLTRSSPKAALEKFVQTSGNSTWAEALQRISEAREQRVLPPGVAGTNLLKLIEIARQMRASLSKLT